MPLDCFAYTRLCLRSVFTSYLEAGTCVQWSGFRGTQGISLNCVIDSPLPSQHENFAALTEGLEWRLFGDWV